MARITSTTLQAQRDEYAALGQSYAQEAYDFLTSTIDLRSIVLETIDNDKYDEHDDRKGITASCDKDVLVFCLVTYEEEEPHYVCVDYESKSVQEAFKTKLGELLSEEVLPVAKVGFDHESCRQHIRVQHRCTLEIVFDVSELLKSS